MFFDFFSKLCLFVGDLFVILSQLAVASVVFVSHALKRVHSFFEFFLRPSNDGEFCVGVVPLRFQRVGTRLDISLFLPRRSEVSSSFLQLFPNVGFPTVRNRSTSPSASFMVASLSSFSIFICSFISSTRWSMDSLICCSIWKSSKRCSPTFSFNPEISIAESLSFC